VVLLPGLESGDEGLSLLPPAAIGEARGGAAREREGLLPKEPTCYS